MSHGYAVRTDARASIIAALKTVGRERVARGARVFTERPNNGYDMDEPLRAQTADCFVGWMHETAPGELGSFGDTIDEAKRESDAARYALDVLSYAYESPEERGLLAELTAQYLNGELA